MKLLRSALILVVLPLLALPAPAMAQEEGPRHRARAAGEIVSVDAQANTFQIKTRRGADLTVFVTEETVFRSIDGDIDGVEDLEAGMKAIVVGEPSEAGISAKLVGVARPGQLDGLKRFAGEVIRINPGQGTFTLENRAGEELLLTVGERTRFHSHQGDIDGLEDLERGMLARAVYREVDGVNMALRVGVRSGTDRPGRPEIDVRIRGEVTAISHESITVQDRSGEAVTLAITEETVLRSSDGSPEQGDRALVLGQEGDDGELIALVVATLPGRGPGDGPRPGFGASGNDQGPRP